MSSSIFQLLLHVENFNQIRNHNSLYVYRLSKVLHVNELQVELNTKQCTMWYSHFFSFITFLALRRTGIKPALVMNIIVIFWLLLIGNPVVLHMIYPSCPSGFSNLLGDGLLVEHRRIPFSCTPPQIILCKNISSTSNFSTSMVHV